MDRFEEFENNCLKSGVKREDWYGLHRSKWKDDITRISYSHPAKFARSLIAKIYAHFFQNGWLHSGGEEVVTEEMLDQFKEELSAENISFME